MASLIPGFKCDIFISYSQKDNKGDRCVSGFVEALKFQKIDRDNESKSLTEHEKVRKWLEEKGETQVL